MTLFHNGTFLANNTVVMVDEIGEGKLSLMCFTNKLDCCNGIVRFGEWYFPNGSYVGVADSSNIYRNRGSSAVRLNRRNNVTIPSGIFWCDIPDKNETVQNMFVGIYSMGSGVLCFILQHSFLCYIIISLTLGIPMIKEFSFDANQQMLVCISTSGPATDVTWVRNDTDLRVDGTIYRQIQTITNTIESLYTNVLYICRLHPEDVAGNYSCTISNLKGIAHQFLEIKGNMLY